MKKIAKNSEQRQGVQQLVLDIPEIVGRKLGRARCKADRGRALRCVYCTGRM
jgi:hypothetical protein